MYAVCSEGRLRESHEEAWVSTADSPEPRELAEVFVVFRNFIADSFSSLHTQLCGLQPRAEEPNSRREPGKIPAV